MLYPMLPSHGGVSLLPVELAEISWRGSRLSGATALRERSSQYINGKKCGHRTNCNFKNNQQQGILQFLQLS
jgi:hypothetical protein